MKELARELRKNQTPTEKIVWNLLRNRNFLNLKFRRQKEIQGFIVDFYCDEYSLAIEIDGKIHDKQKEYDEWRQIQIESKGVHFIRVTNAEVYRDVNILLKQIEDFINNHEPRKRSALNPPPSPSEHRERGRGSG